MNYCYICSNKKCDLLVILQCLSKEHKPYTKGIARVYEWRRSAIGYRTASPIGRRKAAIGYRRKARGEEDPNDIRGNEHNRNERLRALKILKINY